MTIKPALITTNRIQLVRALYKFRQWLPPEASIDEWCHLGERAFEKIGLETYCHKSKQSGNLLNYAKARGEKELKRFLRARYQCEMQWDIAKLNRDTVDPSGTNTDPLFPHETLWVFENVGRSTKAISIPQLEVCFEKYSDVRIDNGVLIASDGHKCLSGPELLIEEFMLRNGVGHIKEGDTSIHTGMRITAYPILHDAKYAGRPMEADWLVEKGPKKAFVEYFEGRLNEVYFAKVERKRELAKSHGIQLIEIWRKDLQESTLRQLLADFL